MIASVGVLGKILTSCEIALAAFITLNIKGELPLAVNHDK
ncbi:hypothetical protein LT85_4098 [Collimonas arenae]|uniref:Uncharacterized protein n=1 Tax=Collimonas arenae TaxID=279058 RepID=A0A0A1FFJ6_9BURK|nr:hypothetical protein LT85_4098 [Collimonas arenae]